MRSPPENPQSSLSRFVVSCRKASEVRNTQHTHTQHNSYSIFTCIILVPDVYVSHMLRSDVMCLRACERGRIQSINEMDGWMDGNTHSFKFMLKLAFFHEELVRRTDAQTTTFLTCSHALTQQKRTKKKNIRQKVDAVVSYYNVCVVFFSFFLHYKTCASTSTLAKEHFALEMCIKVYCVARIVRFCRVYTMLRVLCWAAAVAAYVV